MPREGGGQADPSHAQKQRLRRRWLLAVAVAAAILGALAYAAGALQSLERDSVDARFSIRGPMNSPPDIAIVALDRATLAQLGLRPPVPRAVHARVITRLHADGARLIVYDFLFAGQTDRRDDLALIAALRAARPVVLGSVVSPGAALRVPAGMTNPGAIGARLGSLAVRNDADGVVRKMVYGDTAFKSLAIVAAEALGRYVRESDFPAWIDYHGPQGTFATYSMARVLAGRVPADAFRGKVVLVGATDPGEKDVFPTPAASDELPGVEIHANSLATILDGFPLSSAPAVLNLLLIALLATLPAALALRYAALWTTAATVLALALFAVSVQVAFDDGLVVSFVYPAVTLVVSAICTVGVDSLLGSGERRHMARVFARFVPEPVVKDVLSRTDDDLRLGATTVEASVLFCDLRGFSRFAESRSAATVIETLNRYLTEMSQAVRRHGGTVVSYEGDGIMAVFGAPLEQDDHAARALAAAREMAGERRARFNAWLAEQTNGAAFRVGVGVSSGPVTSGCVGSEERIEYAAVGDTTNVAARLQSKSRDMPEQVLISEATYVRVLPEPTDLTYVGEFVLSGRRTATKVYGTSPEGY